MMSGLSCSLIMAGALVGLSSCETVIDGGYSGGTGSGGVVYDPIVYAWYDMYGNGCSTGNPRPGCNFYWYNSKLVKIIDQEDPYFTAYYYNLTYDTYYYKLNGVTYSFSGFAWVSPTGIIYNEYGNALNQRNTRGRDSAAKVARQELKIVEQAGKEFAAKYSLSVEKGIQVARSLNEWSKLGRDRQKTEADLASFTEKLYGINYNSIKSALLEAQKGNTDAMRATVAQAAKNWGTNEETMKDILKNWYRNVPGLD